MREDPLPDADPNEKFYVVSSLKNYFSTCQEISCVQSIQLAFALFDVIITVICVQGDNQNRLSGQALEFKQLNLHAFEAFDKGQDVHMQAAPSQAELLYKNFKVNKEKLKSQVKDTIMEKYGNAASEMDIPRELLLGQSDRQVEYDRAGRIIKGQVLYPTFLMC